MNKKTFVLGFCIYSNCNFKSLPVKNFTHFWWLRRKWSCWLRRKWSIPHDLTYLYEILKLIIIFKKHNLRSGSHINLWTADFCVEYGHILNGGTIFCTNHIRHRPYSAWYTFFYHFTRNINANCNVNYYKNASFLIFFW